MKSYTVILCPDPVGGYVAIVPSMRGALTQGESRDETLANIAKVMAIWLEIAVEDGYAPADETAEFVSQRLAEVLEDRAAEGWDWSAELIPVRPAAMAAA